MSDGKKKPAPFKVQWEKYVLRRAKLKNSTHALVGLAYIGYANPDGTNKRPPAMKTIAEDLGLSERTVERAFEGLEAAGLIERLTRGVPGRASHWRFVIPDEDPTALTGVSEEKEDPTVLTETPDSLDGKTRQPCQEDPTAVTAYQHKDQHTTNTPTNTVGVLKEDPWELAARIDLMERESAEAVRLGMVDLKAAAKEAVPA
ncbi:helix-turn-helix domain-containing protein [Streptomyces thermodiastaticus]|uniref:helix-turn-helix domain-containing protein n=1 Tax=Streptomyces thermodiastaticus TaxID=44061 RepID=UPI0016782F4D|nr:helix-turn-helix domain-containing protein [Streptomyces thermodiastaticus]MCE7552774.1 helix-turn-helix domain-containing protein [Streptomyces thermodiastaticus]GHF89001.1 hypothetical protein GCM10018787_42100 [Streptomyces thermodiastaticus]